MELINNTVLITGGSSGIGLELARSLIEKGNTVLVCARTQSKLEEAKALLPKLQTYCCDICDSEQRQKMLQQIRADGYRVNLLVNNAAIMSNFDLSNADDQSIEKIKYEISLNMVAPIELIHELLPTLKSQTRPAIINILSPQGIVPGARTPILSATKAGLYSYSRSLRLHLETEGISVVNVFPPGVETPKTANLDFKKISANKFVEKLLKQLQKGNVEIWIGESKALRIIARISQLLAFTLLNKRLPIIKAAKG